MSKQIFVRFARKPYDFKDVEAEAASTYAESDITQVAETKKLTAKEYDAFISNFMQTYDWLAGKGGFKRNIRQAITITAPNRKTIFVDPSGHNYPRYVGLQVET